MPYLSKSNPQIQSHRNLSNNAQEFTAMKWLALDIDSIADSKTYDLVVCICLEILIYKIWGESFNNEIDLFEFIEVFILFSSISWHLEMMWFLLSIPCRRGANLAFTFASRYKWGEFN